MRPALGRFQTREQAWHEKASDPRPAVQSTLEA